VLEVLVRSGKLTTSNALWGSGFELAEGHREAEPYRRGWGLAPPVRL
jgi:hypothetical protein